MYMYIHLSDVSYCVLILVELYHVHARGHAPEVGRETGPVDQDPETEGGLDHAPVLAHLLVDVDPGLHVEPGDLGHHLTGMLMSLLSHVRCYPSMRQNLCVQHSHYYKIY